jgi:hypothetical protein
MRISSCNKQGQCQTQLNTAWGKAAVCLDKRRTQILQAKRFLPALWKETLPLRIILAV